MAQTAGVKAMQIAGRVASERERCLGMTDIERAWRKQWLNDQILAPHEPVFVPQYWKERNNFFKRIYRAPLDILFAGLTPVLGASRADDYRYLTGKFIMIGFGILCAHYYFKYGTHDWTRKGGWRVHKSKPMVLPGQKGFPFISKRGPNDYDNRGFKKSPI